jgi:hypothetical protein
VYKLNGWGTTEEISREVSHINYDLSKILTLMEDAGIFKHATGAQIAFGIVQGAPFLLKGREVPSLKEKVYFLAIPQKKWGIKSF